MGARKPFQRVVPRAVDDCYRLPGASRPMVWAWLGSAGRTVGSDTDPRGAARHRPVQHRSGVRRAKLLLETSGRPNAGYDAGRVGMGNCRRRTDEANRNHCDYRTGGIRVLALQPGPVGPRRPVASPGQCACSGYWVGTGSVHASWDTEGNYLTRHCILRAHPDSAPRCAVYSRYST